MKVFPGFRWLLAVFLAALAALPVGTASAAIPCIELPVIEADPNMPVPLIYIELPVSVEGAFSRGMAADRTTTTEIEDDIASSVAMAAENQLRCLGYGMDTVFLGNSTPEQRVLMFARPNIEADVEQYIQLDSLYVADLGDPIGLEDGRFLIDFKIIVDGTDYLQGEMIFVAVEGDYYLDSSALTSDVEFLAEPTVVELSTTFTREVKIIEVTNGDMVVFDNQEDEASATIVITDESGETIFEGFAGGTMLVGGENSNIFVVHDLKPGEYQVNVTFSPDDIKYGATIVVAEGSATPVASPEATPDGAGS